ncbi:hypothetical protein GCM10022232_68940 [Streptomyces plumbiresistens]|uniref:Uncharacterized protein n=1 Tax=Streptomyces plumbiresistens TaxID=511811 RepID=A0ABP7STD7_9ACTN
MRARRQALPGFNRDSLDEWLYEANPVEGCERCAAEVVRLNEAVYAGMTWVRYDAAREIRSHPHTEEISRA